MNVPNESNIDNSIDEDLTEKINKIMNETTYFNSSTVNMVNIYFFYCVNHSLEQYTKVVVPLKLGVLNKDELLATILKYRTSDGRRFNVSGIYSYQFTQDITTFLKESSLSMNEYSQVEEITFKPMIELFQHHSSIFILLNNEKMKNTKKLYDSKPKRKTMKI
uniref:Uncharacterized protein n=1 Tax=viral metagenome TaxID=1070528 RepID=A0A6C0EV02_9ZZZZ